MLLRLLPPPTATSANPPTILFTLSHPNSPYTGRSLPLPANLLAHQTVCLQEDIECPNVLLGEKSSWIMGIVADVTFALQERTVLIELIDGSKTAHQVSDDCAVMLRRVCDEVQLSLTPSPTPMMLPTPAPSPPRSRTSSAGSIHSQCAEAGPSTPPRPTITIPSKRSPSSLLYSLISPLLPGMSPHRSSYAHRPSPARSHRRQARSLLVDTFRRFILPTLKMQLPPTFIAWSTSRESKELAEEFEGLQRDINRLVQAYQCDWQPIPARRVRMSMSDLDLGETGCMSAGSSVFSDDESEVDHADGAVSTPATSIYSGRSGHAAAVSPQAFLLAIPPSHTIPLTSRRAYNKLVDRASTVAARMQVVKRLNANFVREEGKRAWLETLDRGRFADRGLRRALSNGELRPEQCKGVEPMQRSKMWRSWTAGDQARVDYNAERAMHPAMMEMDGIMDDAASDVGSDVSDAESEGLPVTPLEMVFSTRAVTVSMELPSPLAQRQRSEVGTAAAARETQHLETVSEEEGCVPGLASSSSSDSLDAWREDEAEVRTPSASPEPEPEVLRERSRGVGGGAGEKMQQRMRNDEVVVVRAAGEEWASAGDAEDYELSMRLHLDQELVRPKQAHQATRISWAAGVA